MKNKVTNRAIAALLAVLLLVGMLPLAHAAAALSVSPVSGVTIGDTGSSTTAFCLPPASGSSMAATLQALDANGQAASVTWSSSDSDFPIGKSTGKITGSIPTASKYVTYTAALKSNSQVTATYSVYFLPRFTVKNDYTTYEFPQNGDVSRNLYASVDPQIYQNYHLVEWSVDRPDVLQIDASGTSVCFFTPRRAGTATLTCSLSSNPSIKAQTSVAVSGILAQTADGAFEKVNCYVGQTLSLNAGTDAAVTWSSSDPATASVSSDGLVTALKEGHAVITAQSGSYRSELYVQTLIEGKPYAELLYTSSYSSLYPTSACTSAYTAQQQYLPGNSYKTSGLFFDVTSSEPQTFYMKESNSATNVSMTLYYDTQLWSAAALRGGEAFANVASGKATSFSIQPGENRYTIRLTDKTNADNYTDYPFIIHQAYNTKSALSGVTVAPTGRTARSNVLIGGKTECTLFRAGTQTSGFTASVYDYDVYVGNDADAVRFTVKTQDTRTGHYACSTDGGTTWHDTDAAALLSNLPLQNGEAQIKIKVCSDTAYRQAALDGSDPFAASNVYTVSVHAVATDTVQVNTLTLSDGTRPCTPGFSPQLQCTAALVEHETGSVTVTFTAAHGQRVYSASSYSTLSSQTVNESYRIEPVGQADNGDDVYTLTVDTPLTTNFNQITSAIAVAAENGSGLELRRVYTIYFFKIGTTYGVLQGMPDAITDYLCVGSQYTGGGNNGWGIYGLFPEKTMNSTGNWNSCISLGNYGGSITYYYADPITDDPRNPYGVDFTVFGNSNNGASFSEPGEVKVSEDGETWYTLAGSEHYEPTAEWDYTVTYQKTVSGGICDYTDSFGHADTLGTGWSPYTYPEPELYPLHRPLDDREVTVSGTRLYGAGGKRGDGIESGGNAALPKWGYADVHTNSSTTAGTGEDVNLLLTPVGNPYTADYNGYGDGFDLKWAVDENGLPVNAENLQIHYVKIQTCSFINGGSLGEKSTEVGCMVRTKPASQSYGVTDAPVTVTVGNRTVTLTPDQQVYPVDLQNGGTVSVQTASDANVYIGSERCTSRTYDAAPDKGIVRIVVQQGEKAPLIGYLTQGAPYEVRVLTFEDADYKGSGNMLGKSDWSSLIDDPQYGGPLLYGPDGFGYMDEDDAYRWSDEGNTGLTSVMPECSGMWCFWSGAHAISHYNSGNTGDYGDFSSQLTVYKAGVDDLETTGGGHNGSDNFAIHFGYIDGSPYNMTENLPFVAFADGEEHVLDSMYVNNTCYAIGCYMDGNGLTASIGPDDWVKIVATGYTADGTTVSVQPEMYLCNGPDNIVTDWTKWDLSAMGKVNRVEFNITGSSDNGYGFSQPAYFAYDDLAVRFETSGSFVEPLEPAANKATVIDTENGVIYGLAPNVTDWREYVSVKSGFTVTAAASGNNGTNDVYSTGSTIRVYSGDTLVKEYTLVLFGDLDGNGWYDGTDAYFVKLVTNSMLSPDALTAAQLMAADCNHDGAIDAADAAILGRAGLLLSSIDQTASSQELQTNGVYLEYCGLIDQTIETDEPDEPTPTAPSVWQKILNFFRKILNFIVRVFSAASFR